MLNRIAFDSAVGSGGVLARLKLVGELARVKAELKGANGALARLKLSARANQIRVELGVAAATPAPDEDELSDDPNSPNYRYRDTGYIPDSRKEEALTQIRRAGASGIQLKATDIDWEAIEKNPRQAADLIIKSNLFGKTDWETLQAGGMESGAGFLIDRVYAAIAPQPSENTSQARHDYALALQTIRQRLETCKAPKDVTEVLEEIKQELLGAQLNPEEAERYQALEVRSDELYAQYRAAQAERDALNKPASELRITVRGLEYEQQKRARRKWKPDPEIDEQIAELKAQLRAAEEKVDQWMDAAVARLGVQDKVQYGNRWGAIRDFYIDDRRAIIKQQAEITTAARQRNMQESALTRGWLTFGQRFFDLLNYRSSKGSEAFRSHIANAMMGKFNDWAWAASTDPTTVKRATKKEVGFQLRIADKYERVGGAEITVDSTAALEKMCGFSAVQSGNWVLKDPGSAKFHVEQTAAAMSDMADILGIDAGALGLGGRLGMAFGARGRGNAGFGGAAAAHYESVHRVINLTKMSGGGALGHEWGHAMDDLLAELATGEASPVKRNFSSELPDRLPEGTLRDAMKELNRLFRQGNTRIAEQFLIGDKDRATAKLNIDRAWGAIAKAIKAAGGMEAAVLAVDGFFTGRTDKASAKRRKQWRTLAVAYYANDGEIEHFLKTGPEVSGYMAEAVFLDKGVPNKYWSSVPEMFARAFQSYLEDSLAEKGRRNDYLSVYADNQYHRDPMTGTDWKPYPEGDERKAFNAAFDRLFATMREQQVFEKAAANKPLLDSIFGEPRA